MAPSLDGGQRVGNGVDADDRDVVATGLLECRQRTERHVVVGGPDALDVVAVLGEQRLGDRERLVTREVGGLLVEQLDVRVGLQRRLETGEAVLGGTGVQDALEGDDAARAADGLGEGVTDLLARGPRRCR